MDSFMSDRIVMADNRVWSLILAACKSATSLCIVISNDLLYCSSSNNRRCKSLTLVFRDGDLICASDGNHLGVVSKPDQKRD